MVTKPTDSTEVDELVEDSWDLIKQVIRTGQFVPKDSPKPVLLDGEAIIDLAMKLSAKKLAKPRGVAIPEDFRLKKTTSDD